MSWQEKKKKKDGKKVNHPPPIRLPKDNKEEAELMTLEFSKTAFMDRVAVYIDFEPLTRARWANFGNRFGVDFLFSRVASGVFRVSIPK